MEEKNVEKKEVVKNKIGGAQIAILSGFGLILIFVFAFGCYGCSYQPSITIPGQDEAVFTLELLKDSNWALDTAEGETALPELKNAVIDNLAFGTFVDDTSLKLQLLAKGKTPIVSLLSYDEGTGFSIIFEGKELPIKVVYSQSKDGTNEVIILRGNESNTQCYYLRQ
ncbi:MAG: hypothetical protein GX938_10060 [Spirochaetales bacterium]|jgi:hypothetical protein|nr:hypothetical protein [Spirochaetales bacterium]